MLEKIKSILKEKYNGTVFGEATAILNDIHSRNKILFAFEMIVTYIISIFITGFFCLMIINLGERESYAITPWNMVAAWMKKGILISIIVFMFVQVIVVKIIRLFRTGYRRDEERNYNISSDGTYGTNSIMSEKEMNETFIMGPIEENKFTIYGRSPYNKNILVGQKHPILKLNRNTLMIAGPSAGKSATFVIPLIMQIMRRGESAIISDPKSELYKILAELGKLLGYEVRIMNLNPMFLENSDPCNFMAYVGDDVDKAQVMSNAIIKNTTGGSQMLDFWNEGALNLLQAIILRINVGNDFLPEEKNLPMLFTYLVEHTEEEIEADFDTLPSTHPAYAPFLIFKDGDDKPKKQVLQGLRIKLKLFNSVKLRKILSKTEGGIDILNPGRKKCLYFVGSNDQDSSMDPVISLFYTLLYQELVRYADMRADGQLPKTVHMVLDEYANMGTIPDFEKKLSTVRSRNIVTYIIVQDINQLKTKHPMDTWKTVVNDCDYFLILKTNDPDTKEWWSGQSGEQTIKVKNARYSRNKMNIFDLHANETITEGEGTRQVFTAGEIGRLKDDEVILYVSQRNIVKLKTFFWKDHPYGKFLEAHKDEMYVLPAQHYPFWKLIEDGIVDESFDYDREPSFIMELKKDEKIEEDSGYDPDQIIGIKNNFISGKLKKNKISLKRFTDLIFNKNGTEERSENKSSSGKVEVKPLKTVRSPDMTKATNKQPKQQSAVNRIRQEQAPQNTASPKKANVNEKKFQFIEIGHENYNNVKSSQTKSDTTEHKSISHENEANVDMDEFLNINTFSKSDSLEDLFSDVDIL